MNKEIVNEGTFLFEVVQVIKEEGMTELLLMN